MRDGGSECEGRSRFECGGSVGGAASMSNAAKPSATEPKETRDRPVSNTPRLRALIRLRPSDAKGWHPCPAKGVTMTQAAETNQPGRLWSVREVSEYLGVPVTTIYQWRVRSEGPPAMRMGKHLRFDPQSVARWAHELEENAADGRRHP